MKELLAYLKGELVRKADPSGAWLVSGPNADRLTRDGQSKSEDIPRRE